MVRNLDIDGLKSIVQDYELFFVDLWGVVHNGIRLYENAIEALNKITERYHKVGKKVHLKHLSTDCQKLLKNAEKLIDVNVLEDPTYKVMTDTI